MAYSPIPPNVISTANSTTSNLAAAGVFTGTSEDVSPYAIIQVSVYSSHVSATDGLSLQQSSDGTNWDITDTYTIPATTGKVFSLQVAAQYFRLVYTNGATLTTSLRIKTIYHWNNMKGSSQRPQDALSNENDFEQISAFLHTFNGSTWDRVRSSGTGVLTVAGAVTLASTTLTSVVPGVAATSLGKAEDAVHASGDTGVAIWAVRNDNAATSLTSATGDYSPIAVDTNGTQFVREAPAVTPTVTQVTPATTSTTLKASNAARKSLVLYNGGTSNCYVTYGATSSSTAFTFILGSDVAATIRGEEYSGIVTGIWVATGGNSMQVTEIV